MDVQIVPAQPQHLIQCRDILVNSPLGDTYLVERSEDDITEWLQRALGKGELFTAVDADETSMGFVWAHPRGAFQVFPYIHMLVVKGDCRGRELGQNCSAFVKMSGLPRLPNCF